MSYLFLFLCLCYNIPSCSSREAFSNDNIFDVILDDMLLFEEKYGQCNFLITGDLVLFLYIVLKSDNMKFDLLAIIAF